MRLYHQIALKEPLKYIFNHGVIKMYFTPTCKGFMNLLDFFPLLKSGKALYDTLVNMLLIYAQCNQLIGNDIIIDKILIKAFNDTGTMTMKKLGSYTRQYSIPQEYGQGVWTALVKENQLMDDINQLLRQQSRLFIGTALYSTQNLLLTNSYMMIIDDIRKNNIIKLTIDARQHQYGMYHYVKLVELPNDNDKIIKDDIIRTTWTEREVIKTCIERLIGPSTLPEEIHSHLLKLIIND